MGKIHEFHKTFLRFFSYTAAHTEKVAQLSKTPDSLSESPMRLNRLFRSKLNS